MPRGGKRKGAGPKKGSVQKIPRARIATELGPRILAVLREMLYSKNKADRKWAVHEALPYAIQKQPVGVEGSLNVHNFEHIAETPEQLHEIAKQYAAKKFKGEAE